MEHKILSAIHHNLNSAIKLIEVITPEDYQNTSVGPYFSSIGSHIRHTLDFFDCISNGLDSNSIDLTHRKRDELVATNKEEAKKHIYRLQKVLGSYEDINPDYLLNVTDLIGDKNITVRYTLESILAQANSHAIHHYAIIGYILYQLGVEITIKGFGYNPSTPILMSREEEVG